MNDNRFVTLRNIYRDKFGKLLSNVICHVFKIAPIDVRHSLCKTRLTWGKQQTFTEKVLYELDVKVRKLDSLWPSVRRIDSVHKEVSLWPYTRTMRKLAIDVNIVESQIKQMQKEINYLEQQLNSEKMCESKKRSQTEVAAGERSSKKLAVTKSRFSFDFDSENILLSSVLLTPSPERDESDSDTTTFWSTMCCIESEKSNSPILMEQNVSLPGLNDLFHESNAIEINALEISKELQNTNTEESVEQTNEETAMEKELEIKEPNVPFINLDNYNESLCINPNTIIKTEPKQLELEENENEESTNDISFQPISSTEFHRTSPPLMLSIDGNIELEPLRPSQKTSKQIKINLTNSKVVEPRIQSLKTPNILSEEEQSKQKISSEWKTPLITFAVKESMKNATFHEQPICRKGWEKSGMCSIM